MTLKVIFISIVLSLVLAPVACSQSDVERIREINESAAVTPTATVVPTMTVAPPSPVPIATAAPLTPNPTATETSGQLSAELRATEVTEGDCINSTLHEGISIETVVIVVCSGPWEYRVLGLLEIDSQDGYPEKTLFASRAFENCDRRYSSHFYPDQESWRLGDRIVTCLQGSFGLSVVDPAKLDLLVRAATLELGECFDKALETGGALIELVDCSGPWEYRVLGLFEIDSQDGYPEKTLFASRAFENCDRRYSSHFYPDQESWRLGDRTVTCLQGSFGISVTDPAKLDRLVGLNTVETGECYNEAPETDGLRVELVDCSGPWEYRVLGLFEIDSQDGYPEKTLFASRAFENCDRRYSSHFYPDQESWRLGDRIVTCLQGSFGLSVVDPAKLDLLVRAATLELGECFDEALETGGVLIELVDCSGPWEYRVLGSFKVDDQDNFPGDTYFEKLAYENCDRRHNLTFYPVPGTWILGDRVVSCLQESFGISVTDPAKLDRLVGLNTVETGECYNEAPETDGLRVELVDCSGPWEYQVVKAFRVPWDGEYPGTDYFEQQANKECGDSGYYSEPKHWTWDLGNRVVRCIKASNP